MMPGSLNIFFSKNYHLGKMLILAFSLNRSTDESIIHFAFNGAADEPQDGSLAGERNGLSVRSA
jgi:hypothetical protein